MCVRPSVRCMEFTFGRYLPLGRYRPTLSNLDEIWPKRAPWYKKNKNACQIWAWSPSRRGSYGALKCPWTPSWQRLWIAVKRFCRSGSFLATATPPQRGTHHPQRGSYGAPKFWVLWEDMNQLWATAMKFGTNMPLGKRNTLGKCGHDCPLTGDLWGLKGPLGPQFWKMRKSRPNGWRDLVHFWHAVALGHSNYVLKFHTNHAFRGRVRGSKFWSQCISMEK